MITTRIRRQLETLDWDFSEHLRGTSKAIHWYPGTFPSEIPTTLIQALSGKDDLVFDPYGGIGTTAQEALRQGRRAWIVEANPIGSLVGYVSGCLILLKTENRPLPSILIEILRSVVSGCTRNINSAKRLATDEHVPKSVDNLLKRLVKPSPLQFSKSFRNEPNWESLTKWIEGETMLDLQSLLQEIKASSLGNFGYLLALTMISAVLRPASSQTQSWGHIADNVWPKEFERKDIFRLCLQWLSRTETSLNKTDVSEWKPDVHEEPRFWVSLHSWQKNKLPSLTPSFPVKALVTSPPYAGAIDYTLAQRLSLYFLGYTEEDIRTFCSAEIGARRRRFIPSSKDQWAADLISALNQQTKYLAADASLAFVLPHKDAGREIGPSSIEKYLHDKDFAKIMEIERSIVQGRARQSWTSIKKEIIQIYGC